ncbi:MAG TPA: DNA polymerase, partial [Verrucomicrobiae bacterium]|nr:DNA polymerase [Verrucomicrobiae bacterium]
MAKRLFLLDGMALVYRAHFALIARPIFTSKGVNSSALYGFTQTLLEILSKQQPTHLAVAFDTDAPTPRHTVYPEYKATRQAMPEDLSAALPHVRRMLEAFHVPILECDGYEADDIIGTLARRAEKEGFQTYMVTPDKDFGQLVDENTFLYRPSRQGDGVEIMGIPEIRARWGIERTEQVIDILALMGDSVDNVPGVPGIGEKTATKLIAQFGSVENLLAKTSELKGKLKENLETHRDMALLSKKLVTLDCNSPCEYKLEELKLRPPDEPKVKEMLIEWEFNSIGKRLFGDDFKAGRGFQSKADSTTSTAAPAEPSSNVPPSPTQEQLPPLLEGEGRGEGEASKAPTAPLKHLADVPHDYKIISTAAERAKLIKTLSALPSFCFKADTSGDEAKDARLSGLAFSLQAHAGFYVPLPDEKTAGKILQEFRPVLEAESIEKVGHNLKFDASVLKWRRISLRGKLFDTMVAHSLIEPDMRHTLGYLSEAYLGYSLSVAAEGAKEEQLSLGDVASEKTAERTMEMADVALQLRDALEPSLKEKAQERVFYEIESPLISVLVDMEFEGIRVESAALAEFSAQLSREMDHLQKSLCQAAGREFNLNSPRQLGEILFDVMKICEAPKKTKTGQYATDEQTLMALAPEHEVVRQLLDYRAASKLKSTYADALPTAIWPKTNRVHTTYNQVA